MDTTIIQDRIEDKGIKIKWLAEQIGVNPKTLTQWIRYKKINQVEQFTKLLLILELPLVEVVEEIYKNKEDKE